MSRPTPQTYRTKNWPAYNEALKRRGLLTIWFDPELSWDGAPTCRRGRQQSYSDAAIQTCLSMKVLFGMALGQTTGFIESLLRLAGLDWTVPDFSTLSRRQKALAVNIPYRGSKGPLHLLIPSPASLRNALPGGTKKSGIGREGGTYGIEEFLELKLVAHPA
ncbi:transposase, IS4 family (plasmid) [Phaeobacter inhibens]|nr:transposase, IS4 family [Phaeobacter inhibens]